MALYRKLIVWQKSMDLAEGVYSVTKQFGSGERFGFVAQMQRSSVSIPCNIAEGYARFSPKEHKRFFLIALGSARELETQIILAGRLELADRDALMQLLHRTEEVSRLLTAFIKSKK